MPYAKTSLRAEQHALREKMRELGMSHRQIAVEFARRYRLRPRAAWRNAYGWSLTEAAEQISTYAARAGLDNGATVAMTAAHLCEHENWPGEGQSRQDAGPPLTSCHCSPPYTAAPFKTCSMRPTTSTCQQPTGSSSTDHPQRRAAVRRERSHPGGWSFTTAARYSVVLTRYIPCQ